MLPQSLSVCWIYYMIFWKLSDVSELHIHTSFIALGVFFLRTCISCKVEQMFTSQLTWIVFHVNSTVTTLRARPTLLQLLCFHFESTLRLVRNVIIIILKYTNTAVVTLKQIIVLVTTPPIDLIFFFNIKICHESFPLAVYVCDKQFTVTVSVCW